MAVHMHIKWYTAVLWIKYVLCLFFRENDAFTLEGCTNIAIQGFRIAFDLTPSDLVFVKLDRNLATSRDTSFLLVESGSGIESSSTPSDFLAPTTVAVQADSYTRDSTRPQVMPNGFQMFDLDAGTFTLQFSEPVNATAPFIDTTSLSFQHHFNSTSDEDIFQVEVLSCPDCVDGSIVTFTFPPNELNRVKLSERVCSSASNCWLTVQSPGNVITDMAGNNLVELPNTDRNLTRSLISFVDDTTGPVLTDFVLNLTSRELLLTFDEPVSLATFDTTGLTFVAFVGATNMEETYQLTGGTILSPEGAEVRLALSADDVNGLQSRPDLANDIRDTWIVVSANAASDVTYQQTRAQEVAVRASLVVPDQEPPVLSAFDIDFNDNTMRLLFSEPVTVSSVQLTQLTVVSSRSLAPLVSYGITGGDTHPTPLAASAEVVFNLTEGDIAFLKGSVGIATNLSDIFLVTGAGLGEDTSGTPNLATHSVSAVGVRNFEADVTHPELLSFTLDMDNGEVVLSFSDVVDATTFDVSGLTFQGQNNRVPLEWHTLSAASSTASSANSFSVIVFLGADDLNRIKQIRTLATSEDDTYLTVSAFLVDDLAGTDLTAITDGKALQTIRFRQDAQAPVLERWTLDMDQSQLILTFSEVVDILTLDVTGIRLQNTGSGYPLTGYDQLIPADADRVVAIQLSRADSNAIKLDTGLGTGNHDSYLSLSSDAVYDMNSNAIQTSNALQVGDYYVDETDPRIESFDLDLNLGLLSLYFDETIIASTFNVSGLTLVDRFSLPTASYTLSRSTHSSEDSDQIVVTLSKVDLDSITAQTSLATGLSSTFLTATIYTVRDKTQNRLMEVLASSAINVDTFTQDATNPVLESFSLDVSNAELSLTFSESALATSLMPTEIALLSSSNGGESLLLSGGTLASTEAGTSVTLILNEEDLNELKLNTGLGITVDNTFISLTSSAVMDPASNPVTPINTLQASSVVRDNVPPTLESFSLDLDQRALSLTFDEPILAGSFSIVGISLQDDSSLPAQSVTLTRFSTIPTTSNGVQFIIELSDVDFNALTASFPLATMETNTFITLLGGTLKDMQGNNIEELPMDNALQVTSHEEDRMRPAFSSFDLDLNLGILTVVFSESVNVTSFDPTRVMFQSSSSSPSHFFTLTGGLVSQDVSTTIDVDFQVADLNILKQMVGLASAGADTYISFASGLVEDMNGNSVESVGMQEAEAVTLFTEDTTSPRLLSFNMDFNSGIVTIAFDETVDLSTVTPSAITFHDGSGELIQSSHTLFNSTILDFGLYTSTRLQLGINDLNELKRLRICTAEEACFLTCTSTLVVDTAVDSNANEPILSTLPRLALSYVADTTHPRVAAYSEFDLNQGVITLQFSETVDHASLNQSVMVLHDTYVHTTHEFSPLQLTSLSGDGPTILLGLGPDDQNRLKLNTELCTRSENCWIRFGSDFLADVNGNPIEPIEVDTINAFHRPSNFVPDTTPPELLSFNIDLDSGDMTFTFNEVVRLSTFDPTAFVFQDSHLSSSYVSLRERGLFYRSTDGLQVNLTMTKGDLNLLKSYELVFASFDSSYLTYSNLTIADVSLVGLQPRTDGVDVLLTSVFTPDTTRPELEGFTLFSLDNGSMILQFSEPINISAINVSEIAIANSSALDLRIYDPVNVNAWISVLFENGSVFNLTHTFHPGEYILTCPEGFLLQPTEPPPMPQLTPLAMQGNTSGSGSGSGASGSGSGQMNNTDTMEMEDEMETEIVVEEVPFYPLSLRGCTLYENVSKTEPFHFFDGGDLTYVDERKQQIMLNFTRSDLRYFKLAGHIAESDLDTWVAFNESAFLDISENEVISSNLFDATKMNNGGFERDVTPPTFEFFILDLNNDILSLYFDDVMDYQSVDPKLITISEFEGSNNSYTFKGPYDYPKPQATIDQQDDFVISIPLAFDDYNTIKANLNLATDISNTYITFPSTIASDIYSRTRIAQGVPYPSETQAFRVIPDTTGAILVNFTLDLNTHELTLNFSEVVNPSTYTPVHITIQNAENSSNLTLVPVFESHTLISGVPTVNDTLISTVIIQLDTDASALKIQSNLSNTRNDTFITIEEGAFVDSSDNPNLEIADGVALQAWRVVEDITPPYLEYYDLNMTANTLTMKFFEAVRQFDPSGITLWSSEFTHEESLQLSTNSVLEFVDFSATVIVHFTEEDENYLKRPAGVIATSVNTSFLTLDSLTAVDYVGLEVVEIQQERLQVRFFYEGTQTWCVFIILHYSTSLHA